jgi:hypothetical protein
MSKRQKAVLLSAFLFVAAIGYLTYWHANAQNGSLNGILAQDVVAPSGSCLPANLFINSGGTVPILYFCINGTWTQSPVLRGFDQTGAGLPNVHYTSFTGTLNGAVIATATVNLAGSAAFTSGSSYSCVIDSSGATNFITVTAYNSGSQFVVTSAVTLLTSTFRGHCLGW